MVQILNLAPFWRLIYDIHFKWFWFIFFMRGLTISLKDSFKKQYLRVKCVVHAC